MRLYLSSQNIGRHGDVLREMARGNMKVAYIPNARDDWDKLESRQKTLKHKAEFEENGFEFQEVDLKDYFGSKKISKEDLTGFGVLWVSGGNTFLLNRAFHDSGLADVISGMVKSDEIVYGGSSAGAILATPSLKGVVIGDSPEKVNEIYGQEIIWNGLNFIPFYIIPHYKSDWFGEEAEAMAEYYQAQNENHYLLEDGQVYVVNGQKQKLYF